MEKCVYCATDCMNVQNLYLSIHNIDIENKIDKVRAKIDLCDDLAMRSHLARKIMRLKSEIIESR